MIFEIVGSRILSPFIGASTYIWTSLIGVILASLSLGYWLGGRVADRRPELRILAAMIFLAGTLISFTILVKDIVLSIIANAALAIELKAIGASLLLFAPASVCLGFVTPFAVKLAITSIEQTGRTVGRLYALSSIGSIAGTFAAGFFLIPFVGSLRTLYLIAGSLIVLSLILVPFSITKNAIAAITLFVVSIIASELSAYVQWQNSRVLDIDTEYSRVQLFETRDRRTGKAIRAIATDPYFVQSAMFLDSEELVLEYTKFYHLIKVFDPDFRTTLAIGGAGYSFPKEYVRAYPEARLDVVEIDAGMTRISREHFGLKDDPRMRIFHEDGRMFINRTPSESYDSILMDAFGSLFSVPSHLTTIEAVREFYRILKPNGVIIFNIGSAITGRGSDFLLAELATYKAVFPSVYLFKVNLENSDEKLQNLIIAASKSPDASSALEKHQKGSATTFDQEPTLLLRNLYTANLPTSRPVLTDDLAPVEYYNSNAQNLYVSGQQR